MIYTERKKGANNMTKQIDGQISFDFVEVSDTREISMEDYMNRPENIIEKEPEKKTQLSKTEMQIMKGSPVKEKLSQVKKPNTATNANKEVSQNKPAEMTHSKKKNLKDAADREETHRQTKTSKSSTSKPVSRCTEHYRQAVTYIRKHHCITVGTIMRICQISANDASFIFQELLENRVIDKNGKVYKEKKDL